MTLPLSAFAAGAVLAAGAAIRGAQVGALDEGPEYIRDGDPSSPIDAVGLFAARQACKVYANDPGRLNDRPAAAYEKVCRPFLDNIGYSGGPSYKVPFPGGQCSVVYSVGSNGTETCPTSAAEFAGGIATGLGPITGITYVRTPRQAFPADTLTTATVQFADGPRNASIAHNNSVTPCFRAFRTDGGDDNCGDPPPVYEEPDLPTDPETGPRPFVFAPDFNFPVDVNVDVDGRISIDVGTGPIIVDPFPGGEDGEPGGGPGGGGGPGNPEPGPELPGGNGGFGGDDEFGDPPAGRRWVGCCIRITQRPESSGIISGSQPEDVYPSVVGNLRLVFDASGNRQTDTPVRVLARHVCVWEPVHKLNPVAVNVDLLPGFGYVFRPYSVPIDD